MGIIGPGKILRRSENMPKPRFLPALVATSLCFAGMSGLTYGATLVDAFGGKGGNPKRVDCEAGSYVIGFSGRAGDWLDNISALCAHWNSDTGSLQPPNL